MKVSWTTPGPMKRGAIVRGQDFNRLLDYATFLDSLGNMLIGTSSRGSVTTGYKNTGLGYQVFQDLTTGYENTMLGYQAGANLTTGYGNAGFGYLVGTALTDGYYNVAFGSKALTGGQSVWGNVAMGYYAMGSAVFDSHQNVAVGYTALQQATKPRSCVAIGSGALYTATQPFSCIAIGANALMRYVSDGDSDSGLAGYNTAVGVDALSTLVQGSHNIAVGESALGSLLGSLASPAIRATAVGKNSLAWALDAPESVAVGFHSLTGALYSNADAVLGSQAGRLIIRSEGSTIIGQGALYTAIASYRNTAVGLGALTSMTPQGSTITSFANNGAGGTTVTPSSMTGISNGITVRVQGLKPDGTTRYAAGSYDGSWTVSNTTGSTFDINTGYVDDGSTYLASWWFIYTQGTTNVAVGALSGYSNVVGIGGIYLGYQAGYYETASNKLFIDDRLRSDEADGRIKALIYGVFNDAVASQLVNVNGALGGANDVGVFNSAEGSTARLKINSKRAISAAMSGATVNIATQIPSGAMLLGASFNVDTAITGATSWRAAYNTGSAPSLGTGYALTQNTKVNQLVVPEIATAATDITLTAAGPNFSAGVVECVVYFIDLTSMADA